MSLRALGAGFFDLAAVASMLLQMLPGSGSSSGGSGSGGGGTQVLEGSFERQSSLKEGVPARPQYYFK